MKTYEESEELKKAREALAAQLAQKPEDYRSAWETALGEALDSLLNREDFSYDPASDPLYQNYRQQYVAGGQKAMLDTLAKGQAMTGGYGNSYAQSAAQQVYGSYLQELSDRVPELYRLALSQYGLEGEKLQSRLDLLQQQEDQDYSRWQDALAAWQSRTDKLEDQAAKQEQQDYDRYLNDRDYQLKLDQARQEQQRWQAEFDEEKRQYDEAQAAKAAASSSGSGGSYAGNQGYDSATVRKAQEFVGTTADGLWGKNSKAAAKAKGYESLQAVIEAMGAQSQSAYTVTDGVAAVERLAEAGTDQGQLNSYIERLLTQGLLSQNQANALRRRYLN